MWLKNMYTELSIEPWTFWIQTISDNSLISAIYFLKSLFEQSIGIISKCKLNYLNYRVKLWGGVDSTYSAHDQK